MSKKVYSTPNTQTNQPVEEVSSEETSIDTTEESNTENEQEDVASEESTETTDTNEVQEVETETTEETLSEHETLIKELGIKSMGTNISKNQETYPSTPMLRRLKEQQERKSLNTEVQQNAKAIVAELFPDAVLDNPQVNYVVETMSRYVEVMSPNRAIDETTGGLEQEKMARMYDSVLNYNPDLSQLCLKIITEIAKANRDGAFNELYALRFINVMRLNQTHSLRFQMLQTMFVNLAVGTPIKDFNKVVNVRKLLDYVTDANAKSNLSDFLS